MLCFACKVAVIGVSCTCVRYTESPSMSGSGPGVLTPTPLNPLASSRRLSVRPLLFMLITCLSVLSSE